MARPKKDINKGKRKDGMYEYKGTVGRNMDGRAIRKSFYSSKSLDDAKKQYEAYMIDQKAAEKAGTIFVSNDVTFGQWAIKWLETYKKPNVDENTYRLTYENTVYNHLMPYFGKAKLNTIQAVNIQEFFGTKKELSLSMLRKINMCLLAIFDSAIENDLCYKNPAKSKTIKIASEHKKAEKKVYTSKQIETVKKLTEVKEIAAILYTGMRRGEVCGLMWSDVDFENGTISINRSIADAIGGGVKVNPPKWNSVRIVPFDDDFKTLLENLPRKSMYVFPNQDGSIQRPNALSKRIEQQMLLLPTRIPRLTPHELRHTYGTELRRKGVDIYTIQKLMGHKDIKMTSEIYVHNEVDELKKAMNLKVEKEVKKKA